MSQFSNQLRIALQEQGFSQLDLSDKTEISQSQLSRYLNGEHRPPRDVFDELALAFKDDQQLILLHAYLLDEVPPRLRDRIEIASRSKSARVKEEEPAPGFRSRMPRDLRIAYDALGAAAIEKKPVADLILSLYSLSRPK